MNNIFITSDWHFNHNKNFLYEPRGFSSIEEMNEIIIENHNSLVSSNDLVYCLGDCCFGGIETLEKNKELIERLNGQIYIIRGNHCTNNKINMYKKCKNVFECEKYANMIKHGKYHFYLSHYPTKVGNYDDEETHRKFYSLCGHTHTKDKWLDFKECKSYHVELDAHNCYPVSIDAIIEDIKNYKPL